MGSQNDTATDSRPSEWYESNAAPTEELDVVRLNAARATAAARAERRNPRPVRPEAADQARARGFEADKRRIFEQAGCASDADQPAHLREPSRRGNAEARCAQHGGPRPCGAAAFDRLKALASGRPPAARAKREAFLEKDPRLRPCSEIIFGEGTR